MKMYLIVIHPTDYLPVSTKHLPAQAQEVDLGQDLLVAAVSEVPLEVALADHQEALAVAHLVVTHMEVILPVKLCTV